MVHSLLCTVQKETKIRTLLIKESFVLPINVDEIEYLAHVLEDGPNL